MHAAAVKHRVLNVHQTAMCQAQQQKEQRQSRPYRLGPDRNHPMGPQSFRGWCPGKDVQAAAWPAAAAERLKHASELPRELSDGREPTHLAQQVQPEPENFRNGHCNSDGLQKRAVKLIAIVGYSSGPERQHLHAAAPQGGWQKSEMTELHMMSVQLSCRMHPSATQANVQNAQTHSGWSDEPSVWLC